MLPSCLAFAAAVVAGQKQLAECSELDSAVLARYGQECTTKAESASVQAAFVEKMQQQVAELDFAVVAHERGGQFYDNTIVINSLGKDFVVDRHGQMRSQCHIIPWVQAPILSYLTYESHKPVAGRWISFRELKGGIDWQGLFTSRCEMPLKELADANPDLLTDLIDLFMGKSVQWYQADIALILHPLPHIPILICYQAEDEDLSSDLTIFFDACCADNLHIKSIYTLCAGLVQMFASISQYHL